VASVSSVAGLFLAHALASSLVAGRGFLAVLLSETAPAVMEAPNFGGKDKVKTSGIILVDCSSIGGDTRVCRLMLVSVSA